MNIQSSNVECPECHSKNCITYEGELYGTIYGCADCGATWTPIVLEFLQKLLRAKNDNQPSGSELPIDKRG